MKTQILNQQTNSQYRDRGLDSLGKVYECDKIEAFDVKEYAHTLMHRVASDLECALPTDGTVMCKPTNGMTVFIYCNELITISLSAFKDERSMFIDFFVRKSQPRHKLTKAFNYIADNYGGKGRNHLIFYRP